MPKYIVDVAKLNLGDKIFKKGDAVDLSTELAGKLFRKGYLSFDKTNKTTVVNKTKIESNDSENGSKTQEESSHNKKLTNKASSDNKKK